MYWSCSPGFSGSWPIICSMSTGSKTWQCALCECLSLRLFISIVDNMDSFFLKCIAVTYQQLVNVRFNTSSSMIYSCFQLSTSKFCDHYAFVVWCQIAYEISFYSSTDHGGRKWFLACLACPFVQSLPCRRPSCSSPCLQFGICIWIFILFHASAGVLATYNQDVMGVFLLNSHIMIWWSCVPPLSPPGYKEKPSIGVGETMRKFGRGVAEIPVMYLWDPNRESLHCKGRDKIYLTVPFGSLRPTT